MGFRGIVHVVNCDLTGGRLSELVTTQASLR